MITQQVILEAVHDVRRSVKFELDDYYCDFVESPRPVNKPGDARNYGDCSAFAAETAKAITSRSSLVRYLSHSNAHWAVVVVGKDGGIHFVNADVADLGIMNIDRARPDGGSLYYDQETVEALRENKNELLFSWVARPQELREALRPRINSDEHPFHVQDWLQPKQSPIGFIKWPAAHEYLIPHSRMRKVLRPIESMEEFSGEAIDTVISALRVLNPVDITIDFSPESWRYRSFKTAINALAVLATTTADLEKCGDLAASMYTTQGPVFIGSLESPQLVLETQAAYERLGERAGQLESMALKSKYEDLANQAVKRGRHATPVSTKPSVRRLSRLQLAA